MSSRPTRGREERELCFYNSPVPGYARTMTLILERVARINSTIIVVAARLKYATDGSSMVDVVVEQLTAGVRGAIEGMGRGMWRGTCGWCLSSVQQLTPRGRVVVRDGCELQQSAIDRRDGVESQLVNFFTSGIDRLGP
jgi:hypothetical protein